MKKILTIVLVVILLSTCLQGCTEIGIGAIKEIWDYREGFGEELGELRDDFKKELGELFSAVSGYKLTKDKQLKGSIKSVMENMDSVLVTYQDGVNWYVGDTVILRTSSGDKQVMIDGILTTATASAVNGAGSSGYMICSEKTFADLVGDLGYATIDVQFSAVGNDDTVSAIRGILPSDSTVSDKRLTNSESQSSYYTGAVFIYGFLIIIALITVFNIFNSMNASVASRTRQYGIMRSIGMGANQLYKMIATVAIRRPIRQISRMAIVDTIKLQQ